jgi:hypothetical protein
MAIEVPSWSSTELDVMRVGLGFAAIKTFSGIQSFRPSGKVPYPVGIARLVDLGSSKGPMSQRSATPPGSSSRWPWRF